MKKLIEFLSKIDEHNFIDLYFVATRPAYNMITHESVIFHDKDEAQKLCDFLNKKYNTDKYVVTRTCMYIN